MNNSNVMMYSFSVVALIYTIYQLINLIKNSGKTIETEATIIDIKSLYDEKLIVRNSKRAMVEYYHNGEKIISQNRIVLSMKYELGDKIDIKYFKDNPSMVIKESVNLVLISAIITILCFIIGYMNS